MTPIYYHPAYLWYNFPLISIKNVVNWFTMIWYKYTVEELFKITMIIIDIHYIS